MCVLVGTTKKGDAKRPVFMGEAKWCGHDSRGNPTLRKLSSGDTELLDDVPKIAKRFVDWQKGLSPFEPDRCGFSLPLEDVVNSIFIPRYYNPEIAGEMKRLSKDHRLVELNEFVEEGVLSFTTGVEVGKMAYGTGTIPFIRTLKPEIIDPWLLFALLNTPIVLSQVRAKQFTQDIIDTIGKRVLELAVPVPCSDKKAQSISKECQHIIESRMKLRREAGILIEAI